MKATDFYTAPAHEEGAEVQLTSPITGEKTDCYITVAGVDSKRFRTAQRKQKRAVLKAMQDGDDLESMPEYGLLASCVISWRGFNDDDGAEWKFSKKNVTALFENSPLVAEQVDRFISDRANFIKA